MYRKTIELGTMPGDGWGYRSRLPVEIEVEIRDTEKGPELSICGDIWRPNRSDIVSGGQNLEEIGQAFPRDAKVQRIVEVWRRWHLNTMRAGCEHQRDWDTGKMLTLYHYRTDYSDPAIKAAAKAEREAHEELRDGQTVTLDEETRALLNLPFEVVLAVDEAPAHYKLERRETKPAAHVYPTEHPDGLLTKPCEVCGYRHGTSWLAEDLPPEIIEEVKTW